MECLLITFGDGNQDFRDAAVRVASQGARTGLFSSTVALNDESLADASHFYSESRPSFSTLAEYPLYFRAAKTYAIDAALSGVFGDFDVVVYIDAGCEIQNNWVSRVVFRKMLKKTMIMGGLAESTLLPERHWTKAEVLTFFGVEGEAAMLSQIQSTWSFWAVNQTTRDLVEQWRKFTISEHALWAGKSELIQHPDYIEHRHDQSIFSLLWKGTSFAVQTRSMDFSLDSWLGQIRALSVPINAIRNRTGVSKLEKFHGLSLVVLPMCAYFLNGAVHLVSRIRRGAGKFQR